MKKRNKKEIVYTLYVGEENGYEKIHIDVEEKNEKKIVEQIKKDPTILDFERNIFIDGVCVTQ